MNPPYRVMKPAPDGLKSAAKVHYEHDNGKRIRCEQSRIYIIVDGERMRVWHRTKRAVTCKSCIKYMEQQVRDAIKGLDSEQYEDLLAHVETFKMKYTGAQKDPVPPSVNGLS